MSKGEVAKRNANYENEKVYTKKEVLDAIKTIPGADRLASKKVKKQAVSTIETACFVNMY